MMPRYICPHCHTSIDPVAMEVGYSASAELRICPWCDQPVLLTARDQPIEAVKVTVVAVQSLQAVSA